jgi:hypothetical protein
MTQTELTLLIYALRLLAKGVQSEDGFANACIHQAAADKLEEFGHKLKILKGDDK